MFFILLQTCRLFLGLILFKFYHLLIMLPYLKILPQYLVPQKTLTRLLGAFANNTCFYLPFIKWFVRHYQVDMRDAKKQTLSEYNCFNDFFTRHLHNNARPIDNSDNTIISPVDGIISQIGQTTEGRIIQAKGQEYSVVELLGGKTDIAKTFLKSNFVTLYLSPKDYHRIHFPIDATLEKMIYIPGKLFSVNPQTAAHVPRLFARNERLVILLNTPTGRLAFVMVGAMIVASMATTWHGEVKRTAQIQTWKYDHNTQQTTFQKGNELGYFKLGSTVIMLFENQDVSWLKSMTAGHTIQYGQRLATY